MKIAGHRRLSLTSMCSPYPFALMWCDYQVLGNCADTLPEGGSADESRGNTSGGEDETGKCCLMSNIEAILTVLVQSWNPTRAMVCMRSGGNTHMLITAVLSHIISQLRPGADLSRVTLPTFILEPRSMLERITKLVHRRSLCTRAHMDLASWPTPSSCFRYQTLMTR